MKARAQRGATGTPALSYGQQMISILPVHRDECGASVRLGLAAVVRW